MLDMKKLIAKMLASYENLSSAIGTIIICRATSAISVPSGTATELCSATIPAGTWVVQCNVRWGAVSGGYRRANISTTSKSTDLFDQILSSSATAIHQNFVDIVESTGGTYYLNCLQNSGSAITVSAGSATGRVTGFRAVRIA